MQSVLAVDVSTSPAELIVARVHGSMVEIQERVEVDLELFRDQETLLAPEVTPLVNKVTREGLTSSKSESTLSSESNSETDSDLSGSSNIDEHHLYLEQRISETLTKFRTALSSLKTPWVHCVVTVAPFKNVSLNLELPFGDAKNLQRIVDLEVQDVVPFDLEDFLVQYTSLGVTKNPSTSPSEGQNGAFDVHVGLIPRTYIRNVLQLFKASELEPLIITVPSSAVAASFHLAKDFFTTDAAILLVRENEYSLAAWIDGEVRAEHVIRASEILSSSSIPEGEDSATKQTTAIFTAIKLTLASIERRYNTRIDTVHVVGKAPKQNLLQQILGRQVQTLAISELLKGAVPTTGIAALPALFADEEPVAAPLSNFRTREFSFNPTFGELLKVIQLTWKHLVVAAVISIAAIAVSFGIRKYQISRMEKFLLSQVRQVVPDFNPTDGDALKALAQAETKLADELGVLGSPAKITPLDVLIEVHKRLPEIPGLTITSLKISGARTTIAGYAPDLSAIERVEKDLKANQTAFAKVTANPGTSAGSRYNFTVEIVLSK